MSDSEDASVSGMLTFQDSLVTNEGEWIQSHKPHLLQIWRLVKQGCARYTHETPYCSLANFHIFASFVYRWTGTGDTSSDDDDIEIASSDGNSDVGEG